MLTGPHSFPRFQVRTLFVYSSFLCLLAFLDLQLHHSNLCSVFKQSSPLCVPNFPFIRMYIIIFKPIWTTNHKFLLTRSLSQSHLLMYKVINTLFSHFRNQKVNIFGVGGRGEDIFFLPITFTKNAGSIVNELEDSVFYLVFLGQAIVI